MFSIVKCKNTCGIFFSGLNFAFVLPLLSIYSVLFWKKNCLTYIVFFSNNVALKKLTHNFIKKLEVQHFSTTVLVNSLTIEDMILHYGSVFDNSVVEWINIVRVWTKIDISEKNAFSLTKTFMVIMMQLSCLKRQIKLN